MIASFSYNSRTNQRRYDMVYHIIYLTLRVKCIKGSREPDYDPNLKSEASPITEIVGGHVTQIMPPPLRAIIYMCC